MVGRVGGVQGCSETSFHDLIVPSAVRQKSVSSSHLGLLCVLTGGGHCEGGLCPTR